MIAIITQDMTHKILHKTQACPGKNYATYISQHYYYTDYYITAHACTVRKLHEYQSRVLDRLSLYNR